MEEVGGGINPLTLAIILVVVTICIAGVLSYWATNLGPPTPSPVGRDCSGAEFRLYSGNYDSSTGTLYLVLDNPKTIELSDLRLYFFYSDQKMVEKPLNGTLEGNTLRTFNVMGVEKGFKKGIVRTNCPGVQMEFTRQDDTLQQLS